MISVLFLVLLSGLCFLAFIGSIVGAQSAFHETTAAIYGLGSALFLTGAILAEQIREARKAVESQEAWMKSGLGALEKRLETTNDLLVQILSRQITQGRVNSTTRPADAPTYYYVRGDRTEGPIPEDELRNLYADGTLAANTPALRHGTTDWSTVGSLFPS